MKSLKKSELEDRGLYLCLLSGKHIVAMKTPGDKDVWMGYYYDDEFKQCLIVDNQLTHLEGK